MEYTQWAFAVNHILQRPECLNPCCNGIYSMSMAGAGMQPMGES